MIENLETKNEFNEMLDNIELGFMMKKHYDGKDRTIEYSNQYAKNLLQSTVIHSATDLMDN